MILTCTVFAWSTRVTDGQTDRQTDRIPMAKTCYSIYADAVARQKWASVLRSCSKIYKKLSYRKETARQLHTSFSAHSLIVHFTEHRICFTTIQAATALRAVTAWPSPNFHWASHMSWCQFNFSEMRRPCKWHACTSLYLQSLNTT